MNVDSDEDEVHHIEVSEADCLYRISRRDNSKNRMVYVTVNGDGVIPKTERTERSLVLKNLQKLQVWKAVDWTTLTLYEDDHGLKSKTDQARPHGLNQQGLLAGLPRYNVFEIEVVHQNKHRTSRVALPGSHEMQFFMKIAPFSYELPFLAQEIETYHFLTKKDAQLSPQLVGYVYEESEERIIGFLCEAVDGRYPEIRDYELCKTALARLHSTGVLHGDINKYNILVTPCKGVVFLDFEGSTLYAGPKGQEAERQSLYRCLSEETEVGQPC